MKSLKTNLVSVIIPCYNDHKYILEAISSINNQTHEVIEIFVIDDGSDVATINTLQKIEQDNIIILRQKNSGPSAARNNGIKHSNGEYILTLDADDYFEPSFVEKALKVLEADSNIGLVTCNGYVFTENGVTDKIISKSGTASDFLFYNSAIGNSLFRKKCWLDVNGFDETMMQGYEDWDFHVSILKANWKIEVIDEYLFHYRDKPNSRNKKANKNKYEITNYVLKKHDDLSIQNFGKVLEVFYEELMSLSNRNERIKKSVDYRIGNVILRPIRFFKGFLKIKK